MADAQAVFKQLFKPGREPRSDAYKAGVLCALRHHLEGWKLLIPYAQGTAARDAFYAGLNEGNAAAMQVLEEELRNG